MGIRFISIALIFGLAAGAVLAKADEPLWGRWLFYKLQFRGQERPPFNPDLILHWEFLESGYELLGWEREGQPGFCHRLAKYTYRDSILRNEVVWVSQENAYECSADPDMQMGRKSVTKVTLHDGDLWLHMSINEEPLIYIFKRIRALSSNLGQ